MNEIYLCDSCEEFKEGEYILRKVDSPFNKKNHGKICKICPQCSPYNKEWVELKEEGRIDPLKFYS